MSEDSKGSSAAPNADSVHTEETVGKEDKVAYQTYQKTVGEVKSLKQKLSALEAEKAERENAILSEQGKYKELNDSLSKKLKDLEQKNEQSTKIFAKQVFSKEAKALAIQLGAMPEAVDDLIKTGDWSEVEIDESFNVNEKQLKDALAKIQKAKPYYFKKDVKQVKDVNTGHSASSGSPKDFAKMSKDELIAKLKSL